MPNLNQSLRDRVVRHELYLKRLANEEVRRTRELLVAAEADIQKQIERRMAWIAERGFDASPFTLRRLEANLKEVRAVARAAHRELGGQLRSSLLGVAKHEAGWAADAVAGELAGVGVDLGVGIAEGPLLSAIVNKQPFQGALLKDWTAKLGEDTYHSVRGAVRQGLLQGESIADITRRLRGTRANGFKDGILAIRRRNAEAVVRTAVSSVANSAREATWKANDDIVKGVQWVSTLDDRTTPQCQVRDGLEYTLDYEPRGHSVPWGDGPGALHWNCRSTSVPILATWKELGIDAREVTGEQRAALDGMVPSTQTFGEWLGHMKDQGRIGLVEEVLGKKRAAAFMAGEIRFKDLFNAQGDFLTLDKLNLVDPGLSKMAEQAVAMKGPVAELFSTLEIPLTDELKDIKFRMGKNASSRAFNARKAAKAAGLSEAEVQAAGEEAAKKFTTKELQEFAAAEARARAGVVLPKPPVIIPPPVIVKPPVIIPPPVVTPPPAPVVEGKWTWSLPPGCPMTEELKTLKFKMGKNAAARAFNARKAAKAAGLSEAQVIEAGQRAAAQVTAKELAAKAAAEARAMAGIPLPPPSALKPVVAPFPPAVVPQAASTATKTMRELTDAADRIIADLEKELQRLSRLHPDNRFLYELDANAARKAADRKLMEMLPSGGPPQLDRMSAISKYAKDPKTRYMANADFDVGLKGFSKQVRADIKSAMDQADDFFERIATSPTLKKTRADMTIAFKKGRAYSNEYYNLIVNDLRYDKRNMTRVFVHEFTHQIEYANREQFIPKIKEFLKRRIGTSEAATHIKGCETYENGWKDQFFDHYVGKIYGKRPFPPNPLYDKYFNANGHIRAGVQINDEALQFLDCTEVLTKGVEELWKNAAAFYDRDPDYFKFIVSLMTGV